MSTNLSICAILAYTHVFLNLNKQLIRSYDSTKLLKEKY